ncbi:ABC transporter permease [Desulfonispora thiosulfatigenes]|uniref:ABC transporter permease n=1 Tax=Desulfonispora thiosulfatigenes TaxID=83661 RepID=UPI00190E62EF|nr:ABC transporter permease [Desulfonispora thiosulfatigenes]
MIRIAKRSDMNKRKYVTIQITAVLLALLTAAIFIVLLGHNPLEVYSSMLKGAFGSSYRFKETVIKAIPLVITSLGIGIAFKMKFWNIGAEGQIIMGAFLASWVGLSFPDLPKLVLLLLMFIGGFIGGGMWALIPAFLKAKWETNETIVTLMMNYIALKWITYLQFGPWKDPKAMGFPKIPYFSDNGILPDFFGVHLGWVITLVLVVLVYIFMNHSKKGYEIAVLGESENTARYAGISVPKTIILALILSGGLSGITGFIQVSGVSNNLSIQIAGGVGYTAIITTWLAGLSAPVILVVSFLFAVLIQGGAFIQTAFGIPEAAASMLQGIILFFVLGSEFFVRYKVIYDHKQAENKGV